MQDTLRPRPAKAQLQTEKRTKLATCGCAHACIHEIRAHVRLLETHAREREVGPAFRKALQQAGIPEKQAAQMLGISQSLLSREILGLVNQPVARWIATLGDAFRCAFLADLLVRTNGVRGERVIHVPDQVATAVNA